MPHAVLKLVPGTDTNETPALNENSGISQSQLIRFSYDRNGLGLVQKLGGWTQYILYAPQGFGFPARALWAWEDLNAQSHLAVGGEQYLYVITNQARDVDITPNISPSVIYVNGIVASSVAGSPYITIQDPNVTAVNGSMVVYIPTQISIGGVILYGQYACDPDGHAPGNTYTVAATNILGNLTPATTTSSTPMLPFYSMVGGSNVVTVNLPNYTYGVGDSFPIQTIISIASSRVALQVGNYVIQSLIDANNFTILAPNIAQANGSGYALNYVFLYTSYGNTVSATITSWWIDNFGQDLIASAEGNNYSPIFYWSPGMTQAQVIANAPPVNAGIFVAMPQRQIVSWGSTQTGIADPLLINWCDVGNFNQWIPTVTNQAGSYRISKGSQIVGCVQGPQQAVVWTDVDCWSMQYIGLPYVYSFNEIGTGCGLIAPKAAAFVGGIGYWMGQSQFFTLSSSGVTPLPCPIWDRVFQNITPQFVDGQPNSFRLNIRVAVNSMFNEIQWFYPSFASGNTGTGENDSYVKYNIALGTWDYGSLARSAWLDQSILGPPIGASVTAGGTNQNYLYQHETSNDAAGSAMVSYFQTGYFAINEGDNKSFIDLVWPDMKWGQLSAAQTANVQITFYCADYPGDTPQVFGPYTVTQATEYFNTRLRARLVSVRVGSSDLGSFWRIGALRYRFAPDGKF